MSVNLPKFTMRELLEAGIHFGHKTMRWNPKMAPYLFGSRNGTHIIDLEQTYPMLDQALQVIYEVVRNNGRVLFVGTKRQASEAIAEAAKDCGQYYVNHRWLGGMLTNWNTVSESIKTLTETKEILLGTREGYTKKEILGLERQLGKLEMSLGGILEMGGKPDLLFVVDTNKESIAIKEAKKLDIPVIGIVDSNSNPDDVDFPVPGNDDATRSIKFLCDLASKAALVGIEESLAKGGANVSGKSDKVEPKKDKETAKAKATSDSKDTPKDGKAAATETVVKKSKVTTKAKEESPAPKKESEKAKVESESETKDSAKGDKKEDKKEDKSSATKQAAS